LRLQLSETNECLATARADVEVQRQVRAHFVQHIQMMYPSLDLTNLGLEFEEARNLESYIQENTKLKIENDQMKEEIVTRNQSNVFQDRNLLHRLQSHIKRL